MGQAGFIDHCLPHLRERIATTVTVRQDEFERIAMPHSPSLLRVAQRLSLDRSAAEDLVQETLLRGWRSFDQFARGTNARAWLFRIMFNTFYALGRHMRSGPVFIPLEAHGEPPQQDRGSFSPLDAAEVTRALDALSTEHRTVLVLAIVEGFTCREMAEILSLPVGTVMSRLSRGRQALREHLQPEAPKMCEAVPVERCAEKESR
jgi:RNA polymerase sigma-70 factor (ECF subfamily)